MLALWATWLIMLLPAMAFRLKRAAFNLMASSAHNLADSPARIHASKPVGIYLLEQKAFNAVGLAPPHEVPLDLIARSGGIGGTFSGWGSTQARRSPLPPETRRPSPLRPSLARQAPEPGGAPPAACARLSLLQKLLFHHRGGTKASFHQGPESAISGQKGDTDHKHSQGSGGLRPLRGPVAPCALTDHISVRRVRQPQTMRVRCSVVGTHET